MPRQGHPTPEARTQLVAACAPYHADSPAKRDTRHAAHGGLCGTRTRNRLRAKQVPSQLSQQPIDHSEEAFDDTVPRQIRRARRIPISDLQDSIRNGRCSHSGQTSFHCPQLTNTIPGGIRTRDRLPTRSICPVDRALAVHYA